MHRQNFIFVSLNLFGSLINVTITITRKFFTILLSVIVYGHHVRLGPAPPVAVRQWLGYVVA
jgi:UDP-galactose transporter B1